MPQNSKHNITERRAKIAALYRAGRYQFEIAAEVGISEPQVSADLKAIRAEWLASTVRDFDEAKAEELAKIDLLEREYWEAWQKSKTDIKKRSVKRKGVLARNSAGDAPTVDAVEKTEAEVVLFGDPRFLSGVMNCIQERCKILGLNAPVKVDATSGGKPIEPAAAAGLNWNSLPMAARDKIIEALGLNGDGDEPEED